MLKLRQVSRIQAKALVVAAIDDSIRVKDTDRRVVWLL